MQLIDLIRIKLDVGVLRSVNLWIKGCVKSCGFFCAATRARVSPRVHAPFFIHQYLQLCIFVSLDNVSRSFSCYTEILILTLFVSQFCSQCKWSSKRRHRVIGDKWRRWMNCWMEWREREREGERGRERERESEERERERERRVWCLSSKLREESVAYVASNTQRRKGRGMS